MTVPLNACSTDLLLRMYVRVCVLMMNAYTLARTGAAERVLQLSDGVWRRRGGRLGILGVTPGHAPLHLLSGASGQRLGAAISVCVCMYACLHACMCIHGCIHVYTHTHKYMHPPAFRLQRSVATASVTSNSTWQPGTAGHVGPLSQLVCVLSSRWLPR